VRPTGWFRHERLAICSTGACLNTAAPAVWLRENSLRGCRHPHTRGVPAGRHRHRPNILGLPRRFAKPGACLSDRHGSVSAL